MKQRIFQKNIRVYDPAAVERAKSELNAKNIKFCKTPLGATKDVDALALVTEWPEFSEINMEEVKNLMRRPYFF